MARGPRVKKEPRSQEEPRAGRRRSGAAALLAMLAMSIGWAGLPPPTDAVLYVSASDAATFNCPLHASLVQPKS